MNSTGNSVNILSLQAAKELLQRSLDSKVSQFVPPEKKPVYDDIMAKWMVLSHFLHK